MMQYKEHFHAVNGLQLRVLEWGHSHAFPIIMMHGIRGYADTFSELASFLAPEFRVVAFDQRGRGESDWDPDSNYYTDTYVSDLSAIIQHLNLSQYDVLGHSMGGINAYLFAAGKPTGLRRLVIEDAGPEAFENSPGASRIRREFENTPLTFSNWEQAKDYMRTLRPSVSEQARESRLKNMLKPLPKGGFTWRHDHRGIAKTRLNPDPARIVDLWACIKQLACPTLVVRGANTDYLQAHVVQKMIQVNPLIQSCEIANAGHYIHDDQPLAFGQAVKDFLIAGGIPVIKHN